MSKKRKPLSQIPSMQGEPSNKRVRNGDEACEELRAGSIRYMALKNFMCHSFLEVNFENNVNVVIGKNGSGKSALLTALIVGLGGKASLTNRGSSIKGFIKAGKTSGSVEIHLNNTGNYAYKHVTFGDKIIIIRHLSVTGTGNYKVQNENGVLISSSAKDVKNIVTSLRIQVDNPICILNQDTSRNFLSSNDPKQKFILFKRATRLETLYEEYNKIKLNQQEAVEIFGNKESCFKKMQSDLKKMKLKIDGRNQVITLKEKRAALQSELLWAKVRDTEKEYEEKEKHIQDLEAKVRGVKNEIEEKGESVKELREKISALEREKAELIASIELQKQPQLEAKRELNTVIKAYNEKKIERTRINVVIESRSKDLEYLKKEIENANENLTKVEQEKLERLQTLKSYEEKLKHTEEHLQTSRNDLFQVSNDLSYKETEEQNILRDMKNLKTKIYNDESSLQALKQESGNSLMLYGRDMLKIKQMIEQNKNKFQHEPRGPLGQYIKVKDKKWVVAVEGYISPGLLSSFAVDNKADLQLLRKIFDQYWTGQKQPTIINSKFIYKKHDVTRNLVESPPDCVAMYDILDIEDPIVFNCIIDQAGIENILLIPTDIRAQELLSVEARVPRNCAQGVTINGDKYYPDPNYRSYGSRYNKAKYLQVDTKEHMVQLAAGIEMLKKDLAAKTTELNDFRRDMNNKINEKKELENKIKKLNDARQRVRHKINEITSSAEPEVTNVNVLQSELSEVEGVIKEKTTALTVIKTELREIKTKVGKIEEKLENFSKATEQLESRLDPIQEEILTNRRKLDELSIGDQFLEQRIVNLNKVMISIRSDIDMIQIRVKKNTASAEKTGVRLPKLREVVEISNEIIDLEQSIAKMETMSDCSPNIVQEYKSLKIKYNECAHIMEKLRIDIKELTDALNRRNRYCKMTESYFISYIKYSFKKILESRKFKGTINIDCNKEELELIVIPQEGTQGLTNTTNLSGGERSFSTVAFLYSLWQCMDFPFYFLDEFDVYMDKLNRTKVFNILVNHANTRPQLQHVFLTPQDVSFLDTKDVCILRLPDPER